MMCSWDQFYSEKTKKQTEEDLIIYCITFNMKGKAPNKEDMKILLPKKRINISKTINKNLTNNINSDESDSEYNMYIINTQECMTTIFKSFFTDKQQDWIDMIK